MNRLLTCLLALCLATATGQALAAGSMVVVNIQTIMQKSTAAESARDQLKAKQALFQNEIKEQEQELKKEDQELARQQTILAADAFQQKVKAFRDKAAAVQKDAVKKRGQLTQAFDQSLGQLQKNIVDIIAQMAKEKGFGVAVYANQTLYYDPSLDITDEVLAKLNAKLTRITVNF